MAKRKVGRPTKKNASMVEKIYELAKKGKTTAQIAGIVGLHPVTIEAWMKQDFEFSSTLKELKAEADELVEASLFKRATGYTHTFETEKATKDGAVTIQETIHCPPDPTSMIFWLKNRQREKWRDKTETEHTGKDGEPIKLIVEDFRETKEKK